MKEEFLHYLWKYSLYDPEKLIDNKGNKIIVYNPGIYNRDSGPDFFNARISIDGTVWAGNIEVHIKSSHFITHGHHEDPVFDNVILHIVSDNDKTVYNSRGEELLTVALSFDTELYDKYLNLVNNPCAIACEGEIGKIDIFYITQWLNALVAERLEEKSDFILKIYSETGNDWDETFYRILARYFGFRVNTEPFEMLATALPFKVIRKHADNLFQVEALLFGTAGLLEDALFREAVSDSYYLKLVKEFSFLSAKYSLQPIHGWLWKFSRLRPPNFPTIRISQLASLLTVSGGLFSRIVDTTDIESLKYLFGVSASEYWDNHFVFGRKCRPFAKNTGTQAIEIILINAVIPLLFVYGRHRDYDEICERAISFLDNISGEQNKITEEWKVAGISADTALYSQALIQLRNEYCRKRRCLHCRIGSKLINSGLSLRKDNELVLEP